MSLDKTPEGVEAIPVRLPEETIAERFDLLSECYSEQCVKISYPDLTLVADMMQEYLIDGQLRLAILDLGCGTGRLGEILRPRAQLLEGVDLSEKMLGLADATGYYDRLIRADLIEHLREHPACYDWIVAAGTFQSIGDLSELLRLSFGSLKQHGYLIFTLACGPLMGDTYYYQPERYFTHAPQYVMQQLGELGISGGTIRRILWPSPDPHSEHALVVAVQRPESHTV